MRKTIIILTGMFLFCLAISLIDSGNIISIADSIVYHTIADEELAGSDAPDIILISKSDDVKGIDATWNEKYLLLPHTTRRLSSFCKKTIDFKGLIWRPPKFV